MKPESDRGQLPTELISLKTKAVRFGNDWRGGKGGRKRAKEQQQSSETKRTQHGRNAQPLPSSVSKGTASQPFCVPLSRVSQNSSKGTIKQASNGSNALIQSTHNLTPPKPLEARDYFELNKKISVGRCDWGEFPVEVVMLGKDKGEIVFALDVPDRIPFKKKDDYTVYTQDQSYRTRADRVLADKLKSPGKPKELERKCSFKWVKGRTTQERIRQDIHNQVP